MKRADKPPIDVALLDFEADDARGGRLNALARGLIGTRFTGTVAALIGAGEKD